MLDRWLTCKESYDERIKLMAKYINPHSSVIDIGCGQEALKKYLPEFCEYTGCDLIKRSPDTIVVDMNKWFFLPKPYDYIFCSGLLEYINNLPRFLEVMTIYGYEFIYSYACKQTSIKEREKSDWVNHYTYDEMIALFKEYNYHLLSTINWKNQTVFNLIRA